MRRALILSAALGLFLSGLGCKQHVAGRCDCTYSPNNAVLKTPFNPYATVGESTAVPGAVPAPAYSPDVPDVMPAVSANVGNF